MKQTNLYQHHTHDLCEKWKPRVYVNINVYISECNAGILTLHYFSFAFHRHGLINVTGICSLSQHALGGQKNSPLTLIDDCDQFIQTYMAKPGLRFRSIILHIIT